MDIAGHYNYSCQETAGAYLLEDTPSSSSLRPRGSLVSSSVQDFLRQSSEIHHELRKALQSPEPLQDWDDLNLQLCSAGFEAILLYQDHALNQVPDLRSVYTTISQLLSVVLSDSRKSSVKINQVLSEKDQLARDLENLKTELDYFQQTGSQHFHESPLKLTKNDTELVTALVQLLELPDASQLVLTISKMQEALKVLPRVEAFLNEVCQEARSTDAHEVVPRLRRWKRKSADFDHFAKAVNASENELPDLMQGLVRFCALFELRPASATHTVEQLYYFVLEMKNFLAVIPRQFARRKLGLPGTMALVEVIKRLAQSL